MTQRFGLLGYPLVHSFSARYFAEKFQREGIDATYDNFEYAHIDEAMPVLTALAGLRGFNVTIPYKQAVMPYLAGLSPEAEAIGAVNVVKVEHGADGGVKLYGYNSDVLGFTASIAPLLRPQVHRAALVLGTGGASRAIVYGLKSLGVPPTLVSRYAAPGRLTYDQLTPAVMAAHKVIVNCSPVGMFPHTDECPAIPYDQLTPDHLLYDLIYNPAETRFMQRGLAHGATVKSGLEMLHRQAEETWRIWCAPTLR